MLSLDGDARILYYKALQYKFIQTQSQPIIVFINLQACLLIIHYSWTVVAYYVLQMAHSAVFRLGKINLYDRDHDSLDVLAHVTWELG